MPEETKEYTVDEGDYFDFDLNQSEEVVEVQPQQEEEL